MKKLYQSENPAELHVIRHALDEAGIASVIENEDLAPLMGEIPQNPATLPAIYVVEDRDFEAAEEIVAGVKGRKATRILGESAIRCPLCGSKDFGKTRLIQGLYVLFVVCILYFGVSLVLMLMDPSPFTVLNLIIPTVAMVTLGVWIKAALLSEKQGLACNDCGMKWNVKGPVESKEGGEIPPPDESPPPEQEEDDELEEGAPSEAEPRVFPGSPGEARPVYGQGPSNGAAIGIFLFLFLLGFVVVATILTELGVETNFRFGRMEAPVRRLLAGMSLVYMAVTLALFPMGFSIHLDERRGGLLTVRRGLVWRKLKFTSLEGVQSLSLRSRLSALRRAWDVELVYSTGARAYLFTLPSDEPHERTRVEALAKELGLTLSGIDSR
ncbi:MAG: putative signal transducing protein [Planctomycetota bacterium]|jgi:DNA-directed RNA polymerase subunit RPC12/RpoP